VGIGRTVARRLGRFPSVEPDLIVDSESDLHGLGFPARVIHTPGHTPGSMVVLTDDGTLIAGDSLFGLSGKQHFPPFAEDLPALLESWKRIRQLGARTLYPAHGGAIPRESFLAEFDDAMERYAPPHQ
jgi:hydroxyacylglutathione hydrolase